MWFKTCANVHLSDGTCRQQLEIMSVSQGMRISERSGLLLSITNFITFPSIG
eukprot:m.252453 g.252453  ORF g.252453 m.252453 type:complete len:52 (+) comp26707_c1_seq1:156-311(+)